MSTRGWAGMVCLAVTAGCGDDSLSGLRRGTEGVEAGPNQPGEPGDDGNPNTAPPSSLPCYGSPADQAFRSGLCICENFAHAGAVRVLRAEADAPASLGVNGQMSLAADTLVDGRLLVGRRLDAATHELVVNGTAITGAGASWAGNVSVGGDFGIGGDLSGAGLLEVGGVLRVLGNEGVSGTVVAASRGTYEPLAGPPCACDGVAELDLAARFAQAATTNNNDQAGLATSQNSAGDLALVLESGRYYLRELASAGSLRITVRGEVELFVDGSLALAGDDELVIEPGGVLDLYVSGSFSHAGELTLGNPLAPEALRLFLSGSGATSFGAAGEQSVYASVYAPRTEVSVAGRTQLHGSLLVRSLSGAGALELSSRSLSGGPNTCGLFDH